MPDYEAIREARRVAHDEGRGEFREVFVDLCDALLSDAPEPQPEPSKAATRAAERWLIPLDDREADVRALARIIDAETLHARVVNTTRLTAERCSGSRDDDLNWLGKLAHNLLYDLDHGEGADR